jgi:cell surface protein SprA
MVTDKFAQHDWITSDTLFNMPMNFTNTENLMVKVNLEPLNNLRLDLTFQRNIAQNETQYGYNNNHDFLINTRMRSGNFYISFNTIKSAFENISADQDTLYSSVYYDKFLNSRREIAFRLANDRNDNDPNYTLTTYTDSLGNTYPVGYSPTSQNVLLLSFLSAYSGISPSDIELSPFLSMPLPDWRITFDGLKNLPFIKSHVKKFSITHSYASTYTISNFNSNPNFDFDTYDVTGYSDVLYETNGLFIPQYEISGIMISEKFMPFFGLDIAWKGSLSTRIEYKRSRDLFLSFSNNQVRERHNNTFTLGIGYTIPKLDFNIKVGGKPQALSSDLNIRLDISAGHDIEVYRKIVENFSQLNTERNNFSITATADYSINSKLSIQYFYNHTYMNTNTAYPTTSIQTGFKMRYVITP